MEQKLFDIELAYYILCFVAAFVLFFKLHKDGEPPFAVLGYINPDAAQSAYGRFFEAILFAALGALIGTLLTIPTSPAQAIAAGLGWTGLLSATNSSGG
ncbi:hypothetical protein [Shewanella acanthi]|uniref:hypothetical protein n=1 Tax=Shewanella acanthi TaxID=2864212 RepID=UPI001C658619|nr:hypothetical protein [Shewanella acanthi]QYJ77344.1 hypothetical protein K0H61_09215 [Shewanella acanthi]